MRVSQLEYCANAAVCRFLTDSKHSFHNDDTGKDIIKKQINNEPKFHIFLESILAQLVASGASSITDEILLVLLSGKIKLKKLTLEGCDNISFEGFAAAIKLQPHIEYLDISRCNQLAVLPIGEILSKSLPYLESLAFESCESLTDRMVKNIISKCISLGMLNISCNQMLTDKLFDFSEEGSRNVNICSLSRIDLSGCQGISSTTVRHVSFLFGPSLQSIDISWTKIDCTSLVYLSGYSLSSAVYLATNSQDEMPFSMAELEASQEFEIQVAKRQISGGTHDAVHRLDAQTVTGKKSFRCKTSSGNGLVASENDPTNGELFAPEGQNFQNSQSEIDLIQHEIDGGDATDASSANAACGVFAKAEGKFLGNKQNVQKYSKVYCSICRNIKSAGLKSAHSYSCLREYDLKSHQNKSKNDLFDTEIILPSYSLPDLISSRSLTKDRRSDNGVSRAQFCYVQKDSDVTDAAFEKLLKLSEVSQNQTSNLERIYDLSIKSSELSIYSQMVGSNKKCPVESQGAANVSKMESNGEAIARSNVSGPMTAGVAIDGQEEDDTASDHSHLLHDEEHICAGVIYTRRSMLPHSSDLICDEMNVANPISESDSRSKSIDVGDDVARAEKSIEDFSIGDVSSLLLSATDNYQPRRMYLSQITELDISQIRFYDADVGSKCLKMFVSANNQLKSLSISWHGLTDNLLEIIAQNEPNLVKISLAECECLSNSGIISLGRCCNRLIDVDLQGVPFISDRGILDVLSNGLLCELSLAECAISDLTLNNIAKFCFASITHLNLSWCENITNEGVISILKACTGLRSLNLRQCEVTGLAIEALISFPGNISYLGLCSIQGLTDALAKPLVAGLKDLTFIDLSWNCLLTDETLSTLMISCTRLREANLAGLKRITSKPFLPIISGLSEWRIRRETIRNRLRKKAFASRDISAQEVLDQEFYLPHRSLHYAPSLCKIDLSFSDKVNDTHLAELVAVCRGTLAIDDYYSMPIRPRWE